MNETAGKKRPVLMLDRARPMLVKVTTSMIATTKPPRKNGKVSVILFSKGKMLVQKTQNLKPGSHMVLAGNIESDSAWFIVLSKNK